MKKLFALCLLGTFCFVGCGSETKVTAPDKFLPPTQPASAGAGAEGGSETSPSVELKP
jgi:uncharacterized protein YcfL